MSKEEDEEPEEQEDWLKEHDRLQLELSSIKDELLGEFKEEKTTDKGEKTKDIEKHEKTEKREENRDIAGKEPPADTRSKITPPPPEEVERRFPASSGGYEVSRELEKVPDGKGGHMPKHPELSKFIARVMEHDDKVVRKKFKEDRKNRGMKISSSKPYRKKDKIRIEWEDGDSTEITAGEYLNIEKEREKRERKKNKKNDVHMEEKENGKEDKEKIIVPKKKKAKLAVNNETFSIDEEEMILIPEPPEMPPEVLPYEPEDSIETENGFIKKSYVRIRRKILPKRKKK